MRGILTTTDEKLIFGDMVLIYKVIAPGDSFIR